MGIPGAPPLPAVNSIHVQILTPVDNPAAWGSAVWGTSEWPGSGQWNDVQAQVTNFQATWGTDENAGILSMTTAGAWSIQTYDPQRLLDPSNTASPFHSTLKPGGLIRILFHYTTGTPELPSIHEKTVRVGFIDTIDFDMFSKTGTIRGSDGIAMMVKGKVPAGLAHADGVPLRLRDRARWALEKAGITYIEVEDFEPTVEHDFLCGLPINEEASAWQQIATAAYDAQVAVWLDSEGILRFRHFMEPAWENWGLGYGGTAAIDIDTVVTHMDIVNLYNDVIGFEDQWPEGLKQEVTNQKSIDTYGRMALVRERPNPDAFYWAGNICLDRGTARTQYEIGTVRPQSNQHLIDIIDAGMMTTVWLSVQKHGTALQVPVSILGGRIEANVESGWSASFTCWVPPDTTYGRTPKFQKRTTSQDQTEMVNNYGTGAGNSDAAGTEVTAWASKMAATGDYRKEVLLRFFPVDFSGFTTYDKAVLRLHRMKHEDTEQVNDGGYFTAKRITAGWSNGVKWPGPATTDTGASNAYMPDENGDEWVEFDVTEIVRAWAPVELGGEGLTQYGIKILSFHDPIAAGYDNEHLQFHSFYQKDLGPYLMVQGTVTTPPFIALPAEKP